MKGQLLLTLWAIATVAAAQVATDSTEMQPKHNKWGTFDAHVESNILLPRANQEAAKKAVLSNSYVDLRWAGKYGEIGGRWEYMPWPLPGYESQFAGAGFPFWYAKTKFKNVVLTLGDFYENFGMGYVLNTYENRALGIDNHLRGLHLSWHPTAALRIKTLAGKQRNYWQYNSAMLTGAELTWQIDEFLPRWRAEQKHLSLGLSWVNKGEAQEDVWLDATHKLRFPRYVNAVDCYLHYGSPHFNLRLEYAHKSQDPTAENQYIYKHGQVALFSASYARKGMSVLLQAQRSDNMGFRSARSDNGAAALLNYFPPFAPEQSYRLARLYPYVTQRQGEWAWQATWGYKFPKKSFIGGKYGTNFRFNFSHIREIDKQPRTNMGGEGYVSSFWAWGKELYYQELSLNMDKRLSLHKQLNLMYLYQAYNTSVVEGKAGMQRSHIFVTDYSQRFNKKWTLHAEAQFLADVARTQDWGYWLAEGQYKGRWSLALHHLFPLSRRSAMTAEHYYQVLLSYNNSHTRWSLGYGRTRPGYDCSGGICRYVPGYEGATITYVYHF